MKLNSGIDMNAVKYAADVREVVVSLIGHARDVVKLPAEAEKGLRFYHTEGVLARVESMFSEDEFIHDPLVAVNAALIDACKADYWYSHEKEWDMIQEEDEYEWESDNAC